MHCYLFSFFVLLLIRSSENYLYENELNESGYHFKYKTDRSERVENGVISDINGEKQLTRVEGSYSYILGDGKTYTVTFVADENGYRPVVRSIFMKAVIKPYITSATLDSLIGGGLG